MNYNEKEQKWFLLDGKSKELAEELIKLHKKERGKFDKDGLMQLNKHLGLFTAVVQIGIANGGPSGFPVFPAVFLDPENDTPYLYSPIDANDKNNFVVPTDGIEITDKTEHKRLNDLFNGVAPLYAYDGLPRATPSTPRP